MKPIKRAIILCWIMLVACFAIKLFGGNWFEVVCTNEHFIKFCYFIDESFILREFLMLISYFISTFLILVCASSKSKLSKKQSIYISISLVFVFLTKYISANTKTFIEIVNTFTSPIIVNYIEEKDLKKCIKLYWKNGIIAYLIVFTFQFISFITRNIGIKYVDDNSFVSLILLIDYYLMILLYYLNNKLKKGELKWAAGV